MEKAVGSNEANSARNFAEEKEKDSPKPYNETTIEERNEVDQIIEETQLTLRALLVGSLAGLLVCISNLYVSLRIWLSFSASQFSVLLAFAVLVGAPFS